MAEKPIYAVGLDAGSTRTRMVVCALEEQLRLLGCAVVESEGWSKGSIADQRAVGDRKSTRLNSSHLGISYAVFCLKKKCTCHGNAPQPRAASVPTVALLTACQL